MRQMAMLLIAAAFPIASAASAQEIEGVYLRTPELCQKAKSDGLESVLEEGEAVLSERGLDGYEFHCEFIAKTRSERTLGWLVNALCEEPGYGFPDMIVIMERGEGELELSSLRYPEGEDTVNAGTYHRCEGVAMP